MLTTTCSYCGDLAENPIKLSWVNSGKDAFSVRIPLCLKCSQSWCPQPVPEPCATAGALDAYLDPLWAA